MLRYCVFVLRYCVFVLFVQIGLAFPSVDVVHAQDEEPGLTVPRLSGPPNREVVRELEEVRNAIRKSQFHTAVHTLQSILDRQEDLFIPPNFLGAGQPTPAGQSLKELALRMLKELPSEGILAYEVGYGTTARDALKAASDENDIQQVAAVARRFFLTNAGFDAVMVLAGRAADSGRPLEAARLLESLRGHPSETTAQTIRQLLSIAVCWSRAGRSDRSLAALRELERLAADKPLQIGGREVPMFTRDPEGPAWLESLSCPTTVVRDIKADSWLMPGGGPTRNNSAVQATPVGGHCWSVSMSEHLAVNARPEVNSTLQTLLAELLAREQSLLRDDGRLVIPAGQPLVVGNVVVYRTMANVAAVDLHTGELIWRSSISCGTMTQLWNNRQMRRPIGDAKQTRDTETQGLSSHLRRRLYRDAAFGTLSCDGATVFALEELNSVHSTQNLEESSAANELVAYDLVGGRRLWSVGGPSGMKPIEMSGHFFLGPPLPLEGCLYCLAETKGDLRLLVLKQDPEKNTVRLDWSQSLMVAERPVFASPLRRLTGLCPSFSEGILICPTSTGAVVAIDTNRRALMWMHRYRSTSSFEHVRVGAGNFPPRSFDMGQSDDKDEMSRWLDSAPLIFEGKALVAPRDSDELLCLDMVDGRLLWSMPRGDWLYPACVINGRVVMVGRDGLAAFGLSDGKPVDSFRTISVDPAGRGVRVGHRYFLPLLSGEIVTVDLQDGRFLTRSKMSDGRIPGNLVAGGGTIVSQSPKEVVGFSRFSDIEAQIAAELVSDTGRSHALALRGELRLHNGEEDTGQADLRESLKSDPEPRVKSVLAASLLSGMRGDSKRLHEKAAELETLTDDPQQRNEFLRSYARLLEEAGGRNEAFGQLIRVVETANYLNDMEQITSNHFVRTGRVIRAKLLEIYRASSNRDRVGLDLALRKELEKNPAGFGHAVDLDRFLRFFSGLPHVEKILFDQMTALPGDSRQWGFLERFTQALDPNVAGRAVAMLTRDLLKNDRPSAAVHWLQQLSGRFAQQICLDNRTGTSLVEEWQGRNDVRSLLDVASVWKPGTIDVRRKTREKSDWSLAVPVDVDASSETWFPGWSFEVDANFRELTARDRNSHLRWKASIPPSVSRSTDERVRPPSIGGRLHLHGKWLSLTCGSQFVVYAATDVDHAPQVIWQQSLQTDSSEFDGRLFAQQNFQLRKLPNGQAVLLADLFNERMSVRFVGLTNDLAIYCVGRKLCAAEIETGRLAWSRKDVLPAGSFDVSVDERTVVIRSAGAAEVKLLNTLNGATLATRTLSAENQVVLWHRGSKFLVQQANGSEISTGLHDLELDEVLWSRRHSSASVACVIDNEDVAFLEAKDSESQLTVVALSDGAERYHVDLPVNQSHPRGLWIAVQRQSEQDTLFVGTPTRLQNDAGTLPVENSAATQVVFDGYVCGVSRSKGQVSWLTPVERAVFDHRQPPELPVLLMVTRQIDLVRTDGNSFARLRLSAKILDKRTGELLYEALENAVKGVARLEPDPDNHRIVAAFDDWQLDLTIPKLTSDQIPESTPPD